jgi:hypothetical protein
MPCGRRWRSSRSFLGRYGTPQAQFYELSKAFGAVPADGASVKSDTGKMA